MNFTGAALHGVIVDLPVWREYIQAYPGFIFELNESLTIQSDWRREFDESWFKHKKISVLDRIPVEDAICFNPSIPFLVLDDSSFIQSFNSFMCSITSSSSFGLSQTLFGLVVAYEQVVHEFETELLKYRRYRKYVSEQKSVTDTFYIALMDGMEERALELLAHPLIDTETNHLTILHLAAQLNCSRLLEPLMEKLCLGVDCRDDFRTPLFSAVEWRANDALRTLIRLGANVNLPDCCGYTPLTRAVRLNYDDTMYETAKILLDHGADINAVDKFGNTPLLAALKSVRSPSSANMCKMCILLLSRGASIEHRDEHGVLAIDLVPRHWRDEFKLIFEAVAVMKRMYQASR